MARRSDHNREELYDMAMTAAREIVQSDGHRALTARNVAERIGYSAGTLYNLFANLDELILHLNGATLEELHDDLARAALSGDPVADVNHLLDRYLAFTAARPQLWSLIFDHRLPDGSELPEWYQLKIDRVLGQLEAALAPLFADGQVAEKKESARIMWASLHGIWSLAITGKLNIVGLEPAGAMARTLIRNYLAGVRANQS